MKIQLIDHGYEPDPEIRMNWDWIYHYLKQYDSIHVDRILKKDWKFIYIKYLKFQPDILVSVGPISFIPALLKKIKLINCIYIYDWTDDEVDINGYKYGITRMAICEYFPIAIADYITTPSMFRFERCKLWRKKAFFIPHGVPDYFDEVQPVELDGKVKVMYTGEISRRKRVHLLIDAVKNLDCDLYLAGRIEEDMKEYFNNLPNNVHYLGIIPQKILPAYLKSADILVLTQDNDSSLKLYEYIKAGKAILGLRGKLNYVLQHLETAYLTDDLRKGLTDLIQNEDLRDYLSKNVSKIKVLTWKEVAQEYLKVFKAILEDSQ